MTFYPTPVINEANEDEKDYHHDLDGRKPVFRFACGESQARQANTAQKTRTVDPNMYQLHQEYRDDDHEGPLPRLHLRRPKLHATFH